MFLIIIHGVPLLRNKYNTLVTKISKMYYKYVAEKDTDNKYNKRTIKKNYIFRKKTPHKGKRNDGYHLLINSKHKSNCHKSNALKTYINNTTYINHAFIIY